MSFADDIKRFAAKTSKAHDEITRGTTIALFNAVIMDTPVDEGRLRGGWQTTVGQPAADENGRIDTAGAAAMAEVVANTPPGAGQETLLTNNMPYCLKIENGSSNKAPHGMVHRNVERFQKLVDEQVGKSRV